MRSSTPPRTAWSSSPAISRAYSSRFRSTSRSTPGSPSAPIPSLRELARVEVDYPAYAVLVADQREAILWLMERQTWERGVQLEPTTTRASSSRAAGRSSAIRLVPTSGSKRSPRRSPRRRAARSPKAPTRFRYLILAADEPMASALNAAFHQTVRTGSSAISPSIRGQPHRRSPPRPSRSSTSGSGRTNWTPCRPCATVSAPGAEASLARRTRSPRWRRGR